MRSVLQNVRLLVVVAAFATAAGCAAPPATNTAANTANTATTNTASTNTNAAASQPGGPAASAAQVPVTLPVLDAMFADEAFPGELKSKLQLTDEQVENLRRISREEVENLREAEGENHGGSTAGATARAAEKLRAAIGEEKSGQLAALVRERWSGEGSDASATLPAKPNSVPTDTRVVVNAPAYRMDVFENGKLVKSYKVGIGYPEFPLPQGLRKATNVIFNPTWTPPDEPWVEGSKKVKVGQKVEAGSPLNPLGPVKIPIGMPSLIHGGKSPARLGTFASHGCVGLTNQQVQDFAQVLGKLAGTEIKPEDVAAYAKKKTETKSVKLDRPVPVELRYETIVAEDGRLHIYRDVYEKGTNTEENLRAVLEAQGVSPEQLTPEERSQVTDALREMARDAAGNPAGAASPTPSPAASNKNGDKAGGEKKKDEGRVTSTVKGRKEVVVEIAALKGKGYPAPAGPGFETPKDAGPKKKPAAKASAGRRG